MLYFLLIKCWLFQLYWWILSFWPSTLCFISCCRYYNCTDRFCHWGCLASLLYFLLIICWLLQLYWSFLLSGLSSAIVVLLVDHMLIITTVLIGFVIWALQLYVVLPVCRMSIITNKPIGFAIGAFKRHRFTSCWSYVDHYNCTDWFRHWGFLAPLLCFLLTKCWLLQLYWWTLSLLLCEPMLHLLMIICWFNITTVLIGFVTREFQLCCCTSCWSYVGYSCMIFFVYPYVALLVSHMFIFTTDLIGFVTGAWQYDGYYTSIDQFCH